MRVPSTKTAGSAALAVLLAAGGWAGASGAFAAGGGLSISPSVLEHSAKRGGVGAVKISNTTAKTMAVKVALRPWLQAKSGEVAANRGKTLAGVSANAGSFTLSAGSSKSVALSLSRSPVDGSLYGAIEVTGIPQGHASKGVKVDYRLITDLRLTPARRRFHARTGGLVEQGSAKHGTLLLAVTNTGNTIIPIGGSVKISGSGHSLGASATAKAIVPGATVDVPLVGLHGSLPKGSYTVTVQLSEGGHRLATVKHTIRLH